MDQAVSKNLAANIKQLRQGRGLTQAQLARASGIPRPTWASLETGRANPTISVLARAAQALQVSIEELVSPPRSALRLYPAGSLPERRRGEVIIRRVVPDSLQSLDFERMELPAGARLGGVPHRPGTREYLTCEIGELELTVSGEVFHLKPGDVAVFRGDQRHAYRNPGSRAAVGYSVVMFGTAE